MATSKRPAEESGFNFTVTIDFNGTAQQGSIPAADKKIIGGIRPELLSDNAGFFDRVIQQRENDVKNDEVLVIPMPQGDVKTMEHILAFFGSECSPEVKTTQNMFDLRKSLASQLFPAPVLRWFRRFDDDCNELVEVLALAHYVDASYLVETVAMYFGREILLVVHDEEARLLPREDDHHQAPQCLGGKSR